jgi:hypothetical protein
MENTALRRGHRLEVAARLALMDTDARLLRVSVERTIDTGFSCRDV